MDNLSVIIPIYNEIDSIREFLPDVVSFCSEQKCRLIMVDDGSTDGSSEELEKFTDNSSVTLVTHKLNKGYGGALKSGIRACSTTYCISMDADGQHALDDIAILYREIVDKDADLVVGSRTGYPGEERVRIIGKSIIRGIAKILLPIEVKDINSGMKIYRTELVQSYLMLCPDSMAFSDIITLTFIQQRHLVMEYPITVQARTRGKSTINIRTAIDTVMEILNIVVLFNPMRIFLPVSLLLLFSSILWGLPILMAGKGVSTGAMLGIISGLLFFFLGLMAEQLSLLRLNYALATKKTAEL